jgi:hypothetical protein
MSMSTDFFLFRKRWWTSSCQHPHASRICSMYQGRYRYLQYGSRITEYARIHLESNATLTSDNAKRLYVAGPCMPSSACAAISSHEAVHFHLCLHQIGGNRIYHHAIERSTPPWNFCTRLLVNIRNSKTARVSLHDVAPTPWLEGNGNEFNMLDSSDSFA